MATITDLNSGDDGATSRGVINTNFDNLNTDKLEAADLPSASESAEGMVELATDAEALAGSSDSVVLTPGNLGYTGFLTGWIPAGETWTYASATTFTISGDKTDKYFKGAKVMFTDGGSTTHRCYVVSATYSSPNTTVTVASEDDIASGTITNPYYSYADCPQGFKRGEDWYRCRATMSSNQTVLNATGTLIELDTASEDPNSDFDTANHKYVVPISGRYILNGALRINSPVADKVYELLIGTPNGVGRYLRTAVIPGATDVAYPSGDLIVSLDKGDEIALRLYHTAGASKDVSSTFYETFLSVQFVGV